MNEIDERLAEYHARKSPIKVGLIGVGQMGQEILCQVQLMKGITIPILVDVTYQKCIEACRLAGIPEDLIVPEEDPEKANAHINNGKVVISTNWHTATCTQDIQVIIDATGSPCTGVEISLECIHNKKHIIMMNVECDVTVGPILRRMASDAGIVYSLASGDEPAAIIELYRFAKALGFTIVAVGKGKNNPLDYYATPDTVNEKAIKRGMSPRMLCEFVDGTKTAVEMCSVSNATKLIPDIRGMHGPQATRDNLHKVFSLKEHGGILNNSGVVDYAIGVHPGVFLVFTTDNKRLKHGLIQRDMGNGPDYLLFRPYHLCSIEVPLSAARAFIYKESSGHPLFPPTSECIAIAKRDLQPGQVLDAIGEYCYRGSIEKADIAKQENFIPLGLVHGCVLRNTVKKDEPIRYNDIDEIPDNLLFRLRQLQDKLINTLTSNKHESS
jgi:predicted homoserine dehydrogenase-like protein